MSLGDIGQRAPVAGVQRQRRRIERLVVDRRARDARQRGAKSVLRRSRDPSGHGLDAGDPGSRFAPIARVSSLAPILEAAADPPRDDARGGRDIS
jgi:hypothetical protein